MRNRYIAKQQLLYPILIIIGDIHNMLSPICENRSSEGDAADNQQSGAEEERTFLKQHRVLFVLIPFSAFLPLPRDQQISFYFQENYFIYLFIYPVFTGGITKISKQIPRPSSRHRVVLQILLHGMLKLNIHQINSPKNEHNNEILNGTRNVLGHRQRGAVVVVES